MPAEQETPVIFGEAYAFQRGMFEISTCLVLPLGFAAIELSNMMNEGSLPSLAAKLVGESVIFVGVMIDLLAGTATYLQAKHSRS